jgi:type IV pilus assembly protein PilB
LLDIKICQIPDRVLSKRSNRLIVATADPSDQEAAEKITFHPADWVIAEHDKPSKLVDASTATAAGDGKYHRR